VALGALVPCLLGYTVLRSIGRAPCCCRRWRWGVGGHGAVGRAELGADACLGLAEPAGAVGLAFGLVLAHAAAAVPRRCCAALLLVALVLHLSVLNQAPASAYFADTLQAWEQGRFIRFHGLAQWLAGCGLMRCWCMCCCGSRAGRARS
jgi:hypothetical protein